MSRLFRKRIVWGSLAFTALCIIFTGVVYPRTGHAHRTLAGQISSRIGLPVTLDAISIGIRSSSINGLQVFERDATPERNVPWIVADNVEIAGSPLTVAQGDMPSAIHFRQAKVTLRFDRNGDLITQLPTSAAGTGVLPQLNLVDSQLTIKQDGHPDTVLQGIELTVNPNGDQPNALGFARDPNWGVWQLNASYDAATKLAKFSVKTTERQHVTPELLQRTPFVNQNAWKAVQITGDTEAELNAQVDMTTEKLTYTLTMTPTGATIIVPRVGLHFTEAHGDLIAEGATLKLRRVKGKLSGGTVDINSDMDFVYPDRDILNFNGDLSAIDVSQLPSTWKVPEKIEGQLKAKANFKIVILKDGGFTTDGRGEGTIDQVKIGGSPTSPVQFSIKPAADGGFELVRQMENGQEVILAKHEVRFEEPEPKPKPKAKEPADPAKPGLLSKFLRGVADMVKPLNAPKKDREFLTININLKDVNIGEVMKSLNITLPLRLSGKVNVKLEADIPTEKPDELAAYRLRGELSSARLSVEDLPLETVRMMLKLDQGVLRITELTGKLPGPDADSPAGLFVGKGEVKLDKDYPFKAELKLDQIALERIDDLRDLIPVGIQLTGTFIADAKAEGTLRPQLIKSTGSIKSNGLKVGPFPVKQLSATWESDDRAVQFNNFSAKIFEGEIAGSFAIPFQSTVASEGNLKLTKINLGEITKALPIGDAVKLQGTAGGVLALRIPAAGEGVPRQIDAVVELRAPKLMLQNLPAEKIKVDARFIGGVARYKLSGDALGGQFEVEGQYPPAKKPEPKKVEPKKEPELPLGKIRLKGVQLSKIWAVVGLQNTLGQLDAEIEGVFPLETDAQDRIVGVGRIRATRIRWGQKSVALLGEGTIRLTGKEVRLEDFQIPIGDGLVQASATFDRDNIDRSRGALSLANVASETLFFALPDVGKWINCKVSGTVSTTLGREWRGSAMLLASQGTIYKIPVQELRIPIDWTLITATERAEVHIRDMVGSAARGRVSGKAEVHFFPDTDPRVDGEIKFNNLNISTVFQSTRSIIGSTPIGGTFKFSSDRLKSVDDLKATIVAKTTGEATPFNLPILVQALPLISGSSNANPVVSDGALKANLNKGVWTIESMQLTGSSIDIYAEGTITNSGRVNLNVAGSTGRLDIGAGALTRFTNLATQILSTPFNPNLAQQAVATLGNLVVYLEVTGTTDRPNFRAQAVKTISENAIRFLLLRYVPR